MNGVVVWLTGLPSSGKSTLAARVAGSLRDRGEAPCLLDGDAVRAVLSPAPGYDAEGRDHFYRTLAGLAALLAEQGFVALVPATAHLRRFRERAREMAPRFVEVFVDAPVEACAQRDAKGLYAASEQGQVTEVPGAGQRYERPQAPDVTAGGGHDEQAVQRIVAAIAAAREHPAPC